VKTGGISGDLTEVLLLNAQKQYYTVQESVYLVLFLFRRRMGDIVEIPYDVTNSIKEIYLKVVNFKVVKDWRERRSAVLKNYPVEPQENCILQ